MRAPRSPTGALAVLLAACGGAASAATDPVAGDGRYRTPVFTAATTTTALAYGASVPFGGSTAAPLRLDLYEPAGDTAAARPVLVWIHGGGFVSGTRTDGQIPTLARALALRGYVSVSISYRLRTPVQVAADPTGTIRDAVHDARAAVRWVRANGRAYRLDTARVALVGSSAGAITALVSTYDQSLGEGASGSPGFSSRVRTVVDFWGEPAAGRRHAAAGGRAAAPDLSRDGRHDGPVRRGRAAGRAGDAGRGAASARHIDRAGACGVEQRAAVPRGDDGVLRAVAAPLRRPTRRRRHRRGYQTSWMKLNSSCASACVRSGRGSPSVGNHRRFVRRTHGCDRVGRMSHPTSTPGATSSRDA